MSEDHGHEHPPTPRNTPHEKRLSREEVDREHELLEDERDMEQRLDDLGHSIEQTDRDVHEPHMGMEEGLTPPVVSDHEVQGGYAEGDPFEP